MDIYFNNKPEDPRQGVRPAETQPPRNQEADGPGAPETQTPGRRSAASYLRMHAVKLTVLAVLVTALMFLCFFMPLRTEFSEAESRKLTEFPKFSFSTLFSGEYFSGISAWFSDTVPFRDSLTSLSGKIQHLLGTGTAMSGFNEGVRGDDIPDIPATQPADTDNTQPTDLPTDPPVTDATEPTEPPVTDPTQPSETTPPTDPEEEETQAAQKLSSLIIYGNAAFEYYNFVQGPSDTYSAAVNRAAAALAGKATVYDMIIPTSIDIQLPASVRASISVSDQQKAIAYMESQLSPSVKKVSIFNDMVAHKDEYIYFRTDHHWTGLAAYYAYVRFCAVKGVEPVRLTDCSYAAYDNFLGSFYSESGKSPALGATPDVVEAWMPRVNADIRVTEDSGNTFTGPVIYDATNNSPRYKYGAFIWGDNPFSVIENHDKTTGESCLLIKESFGNALAPYLTYNYKYIYVMDYRYCKESVVSLVEKYGITDVFFCNNISMTRAKSQVNLLYNCVA